MDQRYLRPPPGRNAGSAVRGDRICRGGGMTNFTTEARRHGENLRRKDFSDHPITRFPSASAALRNVVQTIRAMLREIFDESAYDRFLLRTRARRSIESYRSFIREREANMARKPRCC